MQSQIITDHDPQQFALAIEEARPVIARVFELDASAQERLLQILSRPSLFRRVAVLYREEGQCVGYQFITFEQITVEGRALGICRPLVGFVEGVQGGRRAYVDSIPISIRVRLESQLPLYMVSVAVTPMGYRLAAGSTPRVYPSPHAHPDDAFSKKVLEETLRCWGVNTERRGEVLVAQNVRCRIPYRPTSQNIEGEYFLQHCPDYTDGVGIPVCVPLSAPVLTRVALLTAQRQLRVHSQRLVTTISATLQPSA